MVILGIDPGTHVIGYGLIQTKPRLKAVTYGVIKTPNLTRTG
ncbi:MAG: crossover junction endodeoxyribonuclease RuvC, partial [Planctomycetota bacterium]|nr:crossover junction endodeoxyribonuclease RuvC [Planctomycetota bacterium]